MVDDAAGQQASVAVWRRLQSNLDRSRKAHRSIAWDGDTSARRELDRNYCLTCGCVTNTEPCGNCGAIEDD